MVKLDSDTCRCHDAECPKREQCMRWLARNDIGLWISHTNTLRKTNEDCKYYIPDDQHDKRN